MYCPSCGAQNADNSQFCENCGGNLKEQAPAPQYQTPPAPVATPAAQDPGMWGKIGIVVGVIGIFIFGIILGPIAVVLGYIGHSKGDGLGKVAMAIGVIAFILNIVVGAMFVL